MSFKKIFVSLFICLIAYFNFWDILVRTPFAEPTQAVGYIEQTLNLPLPPLTLPNLRATADLFDMCSVFSYYETINRESIIQGLGKDRQWHDLQIANKYFPHFRGEQHMRLYLTKHFMRGEEFYKKSFKMFAEKIRKRYNKDHPQEPVEKIAVGFMIWPRSFSGYYALKRSDTEKFQILYMED